MDNASYDPNCHRQSSVSNSKRRISWKPDYKTIERKLGVHNFATKSVKLQGKNNGDERPRSKSKIKQTISTKLINGGHRKHKSALLNDRSLESSAIFDNEDDYDEESGMFSIDVNKAPGLDSYCPSSVELPKVHRRQSSIYGDSQIAQGVSLLDNLTAKDTVSYKKSYPNIVPKINQSNS